MTTTSYYRKLALQAEDNLRWGDAIRYWKKALELYPNIPGELAERDRDRIITAINADNFMAGKTDAAPVPQYERGDLP